MRMIIAWVFGALLMGYLGRKRRAGFWGTMFFSLLFSPLVGALALLLAGPSRQEKEKHKREVRVAVEKTEKKVKVVGQPGFRSVTSAFILPWLAIVGAFSALYGYTLEPGQVVMQRGFELALSMGSFGLSGVAGSGVSGWLRIAMDIERLLVLLLIVTVVVRVLSIRSDSRLREMRAGFDATLSSVDQVNRLQQEELERLRAAHLQASAQRAAEAAAAAAQASAKVATEAATISH